MKIILVALGMLMVMAAPAAADPVSLSIAIVATLGLDGTIGAIATVALTIAIGAAEAAGLNYVQQALTGGQKLPQPGNSAPIDPRVFQSGP